MIFNRCNNNMVTFCQIPSLLFFVCLLASTDTFANNSKVFGDYEVHYVAYNSTFLSGDVAKLYGITRSKKLAVVVVTIKHNNEPAIGIEASIKGGAINLMQQLRTLSFDETREGDAIYYVATFMFNNEENLTFKLDVRIAPTGETHKVKWQQQFWRD